MTETKYPIFDSSDKMKSLIVKSNVNILFSGLGVNQSFSIPKSDIKLQTLRSKCSYWNKKLNAVFRVVEHDTVYEVGRKA